MSSPRLLSNRYEIGDTLGYGGMSEVHRGRDIRLGRDVAVKVLRADLARDPTFQLRFRREAQNAAALNHPAIVAVYDTGETDSESGPLPYIVMEYVDGRTLRDIVKSEGPLPPRRAMEVMADASAALDFSHRHHIIHRDVKPANIMITRSGAVKVMDFGIARVLTDGQAAVTQTAAVIGTAQYLSPEQARGESVDARSDVYAAGCVLFELLTGEPPFTGDSPVAVAYQHVREDPRKPSDVNQQVPASLDAVVLKALSKNPANRYQSAAEMRADLVRVLSGQRPKAPMIMSEEERTSMIAPAGATEVLSPGRHRSAERVADDEVDVAQERKRRKNLTIALVTVLCVAVFALVAWLANALLSGPSAQERVPTPQLMGMTKAQVTNQYGRDWKLVQQPCPSLPEQVDTVTSQDPPAGTPIVKGEQQITACIGSGPTQVKVPDLKGLTVGQAGVELTKVKLVLGSTTEKPVDDADQDGKILSWDHQGGSVAENATINVVVGKKIEERAVIDVRNLPFEQARSILIQAGFDVQRSDRDSSETPGTVVDQSPAGNSKAKPGTKITLYVSNGQQISMPPLTGLSASEARQRLQSMGWTGQLVETSEPTSDKDMDGKIVRSTPDGGQKLGKGDTVTVYVGEYESSPTTPPDDGDGGFFPPGFP
ncbi:Stk1 family PASTA domain-containing Ser/Thr kinase [Saccharopolyspora taberi]|uniref:non-specific serine/threonine protein kinase n=1 Tax=Saccharopolyspora taberi TaxID=60895 RepID=A0ABN3VN41_9PSEU